MILARSTWQDVQSFDRDGVVLIPTGSNEQHGPHLPLHTDSLIAEAVAKMGEEAMPDKVLLTPTVWLGASGHHLAFPGTLSASFETYEGALMNIVESLVPHGFWKFMFLNGHGGNTEPNGIACRKLKHLHRELAICHAGWFSFIPASLLTKVMTGPIKGIRHACEAEASVMMHLYPDLVRVDRLRDDGMQVDGDIVGLTAWFDEITEEGSLGFATQATPEKGQAMVEAAAEGLHKQLKALVQGISFTELS